MVEFGLLKCSAVEAEEDIIGAFAEGWHKASAPRDAGPIGCGDVHGPNALIATG